MSKFNKGILGGFSGTVGTVVGAKWKGMDVMRSRPSRRSNKQATPAQLAQRARFRMVMEFVKQFSELVKITYTNIAADKTPFNSAFAYNLSKAVTGSYPNYHFDYSKLMLCSGSLLNAGNPTATAGTAGRINFDWADNSGMGNAKATDNLVAIVFCAELNAAMYTTTGPTRDTGAYIMDVSGFAGKAVHTWFAFINADGDEVSSSIYTGQVTVL